MATHKSDEPAAAAPAPVAAPVVGAAAAPVPAPAAAAPPSAAVLAAVADAKNPVRQTPAKPGAAGAAGKKQRRPKDQTPISRRKEYTHFRASVPLIRASVGQEGKQWLYYEIVSKTDPNPPPPLIMLGGTSSTADMCFPQLLALGYRGYRVVSAQWPPYWSIEEWVAGLHKFITTVLKTKKCHLFGSSLGGYLALQYTAVHPDTVESLALCNAFCDTTPFLQSQNCLKMFRYLPEFYLKKYVLESFPVESDFPEVVDFVVEQLETLNSDDLGSRLMLNCMPSRLPHLDKFDQRKITIIDATDEVVLPQSMRDALYKRFATAKFALMKTGGDFPFLANPEEVTMLLQVHLRAQGVFPDLNNANKPSEAKAAPAAAGAGTGVPFLKLTTPLVVGSPAKAAGAGAGELVGGSAAAAAGGQGQAAAADSKPPPPPETEAMRAKRLQEEEAAARLAELKAKHDKEVAEREAKAKAAADALKAAADAKAAAQRAAADEAERKRADEEARRKQKTSGLLTGLLGDKPAPSAFEDDADPFPATEQQRKEMGSGAPISVVPVAASVADIVKAMPTAVTAEERAAVEAAKAKAKAAAEAEAAAANGDADAAAAAAPAAAAAADASTAAAADDGAAATDKPAAATDAAADGAAPALEEGDAPAAAAAPAKAAAAPAAAGKRAKKGRARKGKTIFDQTDG